ncbi:MAG: hypothetical protein ACYCZY_09140 [Lacisediminihabitans sp.]
MSVPARREITKKHASEYRKASKAKGPARAGTRKHRQRAHGYGTLKLLIQVWNLADDEHEKAPGFVEADLVLHCATISRAS